MIKDWSKHWKNPAFADLALQLVVDGQPDSTQELPVHRVLLAQLSPYFESRLQDTAFCDQPAASAAASTAGAGAEGGKQPEDGHVQTRSSRKRGRDQADEKPATRGTGTGSLRPGMLTMAEHFASAEEQAAALAVLQHAYTGQLPAADDVGQLTQVCIRANYWHVNNTVEAALVALSQLAAQPELSAAASADLLCLPHTLPEELLSSMDGGEVLLQQLHKLVAIKFGNAVSIMRDSQLKQQFAALPFQLVQHWASQDNLVTDSENTIAVLLTVWADNNTVQQELPGEQQACAVLPLGQAEALSACLRVYQLSMHFHLQALPQLWWYGPPAGLPSDHALIRLAHERGGSQPKGSQRAVFGVGRPRAIQDGAVLEWSIGSAQLQEMWATEGTSKAVRSPELYHAGYTCVARAYFAKASGFRIMSIQVCYRYCPDIEDWCREDACVAVRATVDVAAGGMLHATTKDVLAISGVNWKCVGWPRTLRLTAAEGPRLLAYSELPIKITLTLA